MLSAESHQLLARALDAQPDWSDLPTILSIPGGVDSPIAAEAAGTLRNLFVLDHPFTPAALKNALLPAFRSRERQRRFRDLAKEREHAMQSLQESRRQFEGAVHERTGALTEEISRLRRLTGELIISEQKERRRLAKFLHDHLQQLLVSAKYRIASLSRVNDPIVRSAIPEIEATILEAFEASRSFTMELTPPIIHESGLRTGMEWLVSYMAAQNGLSVRLQMKEEFGQIDEHIRVLLFDATRELLTNAVYHGKAKSVELLVQRTGDNMLEIRVVDEGPGFHLVPEQRGLGLFRIRHRLELVQGRLEIESTPGRGSRVRIFVPIAWEIHATTESRLQADAFPRSDKLLTGMIRLLIVDDHAVMRQGLSTSLGQEPDMAIIGEAIDGTAAIEKARGLHPDVILMDLGMPRMSGIEATRIIHSEMPRVRVIGLSMYEEKEQANAMFEAGAAAYLSKGCSVDALTSTIRRCVGKPVMSIGQF
jgi:signal transduction histidine kinase/CheY-like chemotaxis protein